MIGYGLNTFIGYMVWAFAGFTLHILSKLSNAKRTKPDFHIKKFFELNSIQYLFSFVAILVICGILAISPSQIKELPPVELIPGIKLSHEFWLVLFGYNGGSVLKNLLKKKASG